MVAHDAAHSATGETARLPRDEINYVSSCETELGELLPRIIQKCSGARPSARAIRGSLAPVTQSPSSCGGIFEDQRRLNLAGPPDHKNVDPHERYPSRINHIAPQSRQPVRCYASNAERPPAPTPSFQKSRPRCLRRDPDNDPIARSGRHRPCRANQPRTCRLT